MAQKVKVLTAVVKKQGNGKNNKPYTILTVTLEGGEVVETFDDVKPGEEYNVDITENGAYAKQMKVIKDGGGSKFPPKDYIFEKRKTALECSIETGKLAGFHDKESIIKVADYYLGWLKQP